MRQVTIAVMGNGKTTRANVEALIGDVVDSVDEAIIAIVYDEKKSDGVEWAYQYAIDKELPVLDYSRNNYAEMFAENSLDELRFFALWDDDDSECQTAASMAQQNNIPVYDLTNGLMLVSLSKETIVSPPRVVMPVVETQMTEEPAPVKEVLKPIEEALVDDEEEPDDEIYDSEYDLEENLVVLISEMGKIFARSFAKEFKRIIKE